MRGKHGSEFNLGKVEDRAWLGALTVGEGSFFARSQQGKATLQPEFAIAMQDVDAIQKAGYLMGVQHSSAGISEASGRESRRVVAVGDRAIRLLELLRPFLTPAKIAQAEEVIRLARSSGFITMREMREKRKSMTVESIEKTPGAFTGELAREVGISGSYAIRYLQDLQQQGRVHSVNVGTGARPRRRWFTTGVA